MTINIYIFKDCKAGLEKKQDKMKRPEENIRNDL